MIFLGFELCLFLLLAGGLGYLLFSGRLGDMFRDREPIPLIMIGLVLIAAFYHWTSLLMEPASAPEPAPPGSHAAAPEPPPQKPAPARRAARAKPESPEAPTEEPPPAEQPEPEHWKTIIVQEVPATQIVVPAAAPPSPAPAPAAPPAADPYESKSKRALKSVGRFLHLRKAQP